MTFKRHVRRPVFFFVTLAALALTCADARAQQTPTGAERMRDARQYREEMSKRALETTRRRRFEEGKSDTTFPSDAEAAAKPGVVRAASPAEQKALRHNERGLELFSKGKLEQAVKEYEEAIAAHPTLAAAHNNLGSAHFAAGRFESAAAAFRRATELDADYGQAHFNLALAHIKLGHEKEAHAALSAALRAYNSAGEAHLKAGRLREAEESFRGMLQIDPDYAPAHLRLGLVHNAAHRYDEAATHLKRAVERQPPDREVPEALEALAESLLGQHKYEEAAATAERALAQAPDSPNAHHLAGLARASLGQREAALAHLAKLKQLNSPTHAQHLSDFIDKKAPARQSHAVNWGRDMHHSLLGELVLNKDRPESARGTVQYGGREVSLQNGARLSGTLGASLSLQNTRRGDNNFAVGHYLRIWTPAINPGLEIKVMSKKADNEIVVSMSVDVDGAPTSYGPDDKKALDFELNAHVGAKKTGAIVGYLIDRDGKPIIQGDDDPAPGFYISTTGYHDVNNPNVTDPRRYVNASEINYTVLAASAKRKGVEPGDFCVVHAVKKNKTVFAIVGDTGNRSGAEGSLALLQRLGFRVKSGKSTEEAITDIVVRYFAHSNPSKLFFFNQTDLDNAAKKLDLDTDFSDFH